MQPQGNKGLITKLARSSDSEVITAVDEMNRGYEEVSQDGFCEVLTEKFFGMNLN